MPSDSDSREHRKLRIHFVITSLPVGGAEVLLLNLLKSLNKVDFDAEVVCLKEPGELGDAVASEVNLFSNITHHKYDLRVLPRLTALFRKRKVDAVITVGAGDKMFWGRLAAKLAGVPVICSALHSTGWPDGVGRLNRMLTPWTSGFIACAAGHAQHLVQYEKFPEERVFTIPNGVDTDRFQPNPKARGWLRDELRIPLESKLVGIVAALREEKNHRQFVQAGAQVLKHEQNAHFVIVGQGPEEPRIRAEIQRLGVEDNFHLLGNRSDTEQILAGLDVFCLTSKNEANPVSILEALACGIPVVAPDVGSIAQTVQQDVTGILTQPLSAAETSSAIARLLADSQGARAMGMSGRSLVVTSSSLKVMVSGYERLVAELYNNHAARKGRPSWQPLTISPQSEARVESADSIETSVSAAPQLDFNATEVPLQV